MLAAMPGAQSHIGSVESAPAVTEYLNQGPLSALCNDLCFTGAVGPESTFSYDLPRVALCQNWTIEGLRFKASFVQ